MKNNNISAIIYALAAAVFYAVNVPCSKLLHEELTTAYIAALIVMTAGTALVVADTLARQHSHEHTHTITHTHDGSTHTHTVTHSHAHTHYVTDYKHGHRHSTEELEGLLAVQHN